MRYKNVINNNNNSRSTAIADLIATRAVSAIAELLVVLLLLTDGPWNRSDPTPEAAESGQNWAHIGNLTPGEEYYFRVVAVNGIEPDTRETRSDPPWKEVITPHGRCINHVAPSYTLLRFSIYLLTYYLKARGGCRTYEVEVQTWVVFNSSPV